MTVLIRFVASAVGVLTLSACVVFGEDPSAPRPTPAPPQSLQAQPQAQPPQAQAQRQPAAAPAASTPARAANPLDASFYRLGGGDVVRIDVLGEPELSMESLIDPSGFINYPFLGKVEAAGLTVRQLEIRVRDGLRGGYLVNPDVRVGLARYRPFYVSGQVRNPGAYPYALDLTVERAITLAGGITAFGSTGRVYVRRAANGKDDRVRVALDAPVYPGDYIIIEERLF